MRKFLIFSTAAVLLLTAIVVANGIRNLRARLNGSNEVPVVSTTATGNFRARVNNDESQISYDLGYSDLEGTVTQAHIHIGQRDVNGGISVWLCSNLASPPTPAGTQPCPASPGNISGVISSTNVVGPAAQGIDTGEFAELLRAIRDGNAYVNVHSTRFPGGEVRNQISGSRGRGGDHDDH